MPDLPFSLTELSSAYGRMRHEETEQFTHLVLTALARPAWDGAGLTHCAHCSRELRQPATGRPRRFCSDRCRVNAALRRKRGAAESALRHQLAGYR